MKINIGYPYPVLEMISMPYRPTESRTLAAHIRAAVLSKPEHVRDLVALAIEGGWFRVVAVARTRRRDGGRPEGRIDTRSLAYTVEIYCGEPGWAPLCTIPRRLVATGDDSTAAVRAECRTLAQQQGYLIPDDPRSLTDDVESG